jgi:O-antigen/teichoic acid export membrane protein
MKVKLRLYAMMTFMRVASMGGKFILTLVGVKAFSPHEFGRFGLIAAGVWIGVMIAGLEVASVLLRDLVTSGPSEARRLRGFFLTYAGAAAISAAVLAGLIACLAGFGTRVSVLVACIMGLEYVGQELTRLLIAANRQLRGSITMFCRGGLWSYALVVGTFTSQGPVHWSLSLVLSAWVVGDLLALIPGLIVLELVDWESGMIGEVALMLPRLLRRAAPFLVSTVGFQLLLSGGRFFVAFFESEAASGRFTLVSTIASLNLILVKGICEHIFFAKVVGNDRDKHWGEFKASVFATTAISSLGTLIAVPVYSRLMGKALSSTEAWALAVLLFGHVALCTSVISKFRLYSAGRDRDLMQTTAQAVVVFMLASLALTPSFGLMGAAVGMALGGASLAMGQALRATHRSERPPISHAYWTAATTFLQTTSTWAAYRSDRVSRHGETRCADDPRPA